MKAIYKSWGNLYSASHSTLRPAIHMVDLDKHECEDFVLYGNGRSYGDVCLNTGSGLIDTRGLDRYVYFDQTKLLVTCQAGMLLNDLLAFLISKNLFVNVTPGTSYVTIGGMIANDVHGKNHHVAGSFGNFVESITLLRSDMGVVTCSEKENRELFYATIGGLGLTGMILSATLRLKTISGPYIATKTVVTHGLNRLIELFDNPEPEYDYTVAWLDLHSKKLNGLFSCGKHDRDYSAHARNKRPAKVKLYAPDWLLNKYTNQIFNQAYFTRNRYSNRARQSYSEFFYPLDRLEDWNHLYGKRGFFQYQFVVPADHFEVVFNKMFDLMKSYNQISYLSVLKKFGDIKSLGLISFPRPGFTLAMDFPNLGKNTLRMFDEFDRIVISAEGAVYPAKDARMGPEMFEKSFPRLDEFLNYRDARFNSDFWRRVTDHEKRVNRA
jgi:FAD/FMN-containing dehydrogenase